MQNHNLNIERSILASIIFEPALLSEALARIEPKTFYHPFHRRVFDVMVELDKDESPIDEEIIKEKLGNEFDEALFFEILAANPLANISSYLDILIEMQKKRSLAYIGAKLQQMAKSEEESDQILSFATKSLESIESKAVSSHDTAYFIDRLIEKMGQVRSGEMSLLKTGITTLDLKLGGFEPGDLVVIAARPSMGKTSFATTVAHYALKKGAGVLFDSLEMQGEKIMQRLIATRSLNHLSDIRRGEVENYEAFKEAVEFFKRAPLFLSDESYITVHQLKSKATAIFRKNPHVKYWFIDHLRYIKRPGVNVAQEVSEIVKELKRVAKRYGVVVFLLSQLNRETNTTKDHRPQLSHIRDSGAVEEDADVVIALHRPSYYLRSKVQSEPKISEAELIVLKHRDGEAGIAKCLFNAPIATFQNSGERSYVPDGGSDKTEMEII